MRQQVEAVEKRSDDRCQRPGGSETDGQGNEPAADEACSTKNEPRTSSGDRQEVGTNRHRAHEQYGAHVDDGEGTDDAGRRHQDEVPTGRTSPHTRHRKHIGPNERQWLSLTSLSADRVQPREHDIIGGNAQSREQCEYGVGCVGPDVRGHERTRPAAAARDGHVSCSRHVAKILGDRRHCTLISVHAQL